MNVFMCVFVYWESTFIVFSFSFCVLLGPLLVTLHKVIFLIIIFSWLQKHALSHSLSKHYRERQRERESTDINRLLLLNSISALLG